VRRLVVATIAVLALTRVAHAHQSSMTNSTVDVDGATVRVEMLIAPGDLAESLGHASGFVPPPDEIRARARDVSAAVLDKVNVPDCPNGAATVDEIDDGGRFVRVRWTATCAAPLTTLVFDYRLFFDVDRNHEAVVRFRARGETADTVLRDGASRFVWNLSEPPPSGLSAFLRTGIDHILSGLDHVAFLLTLLLVIVLARGPDGWRRRRLPDALRATAWIVSSFTLAHTITLISASLGWVSVPGRVVESAIAASIAYTAIENVARPDVRWRFVLTFGFGLVHGLGFASALQVMLPPGDVVVPLLAFNVGVEVGQLMIVAIALPLWWLLCGAVGPERYRRVVMPVLSGALALLGLVWLVQRVLDLHILQLGS
jgi:hypothetical protein